MKLSKKVLISSLLAFLAFNLTAQESQVKRKNTEEETSVESEYLNDVDGDITGPDVIQVRSLPAYWHPARHIDVTR